MVNTSVNILPCFDIGDMQRQWDLRKSPLIRNFEDLRSSNLILLAHATSSFCLSNIRHSGILLRNLTGMAIVDGLPTDESCVYLLSTFDRLYINRAVEFYGGYGILLLIKVETSKLLPDENYLGNCFNDATTEFKLFQSIQGCACKHKGPIAFSSVVSIHKEDGSQIPIFTP